MDLHVALARAPPTRALALAVGWTEELLPLQDRFYPDDDRPLLAVRAAQRWLDCPCEQHARKPQRPRLKQTPPSTPQSQVIWSAHRQATRTSQRSSLPLQPPPGPTQMLWSRQQQGSPSTSTEESGAQASGQRYSLRAA